MGSIKKPAATTQVLQKTAVKCCGNVYEDRAQYDMGENHLEDESSNKLGFSRVRDLATNLAGKTPSCTREKGDELANKREYPFLIRVMIYDTSTAKCGGTRWFGTFRVGSETGERHFIEIAAHKVPKMNAGLVGVLDGCNFKCKDHPDTWFRLTYCEFANAPAQTLPPQVRVPIKAGPSAQPASPVVNPKKRTRDPSPESAFSPSASASASAYSHSPIKPTPKEKKTASLNGPTKAQASVVPAPPQGPHGGLELGVPQIPWEK